MVKRFLVSDEDLEELIHQYCRDLTKLAKMGRFDPITGRDKEIREMTLIMLQKGRKNVALLAPAGVGKTAAVVGFAQQVATDNVPPYLKDARVLEVDMPSMAAGTASPAEFQERFIPLVKAIAERYHEPQYPKFVLFIDEMHTIMPECVGSAYRGLSEAMKPYLTAGDLHVVGATTLDEFRLFVAVDPAMDRRFQQVPLKVPDKKETVTILEAIKGGYEKHHHTKIPSEVLELIVNLTDVHMPRRNQPDKAIIVMDGACAYHVLQHGWDGELTERDVKIMISTEAKIHPDAL